MKLLLVVGLAAVVIVILIAVFLSVRLGRGDDHEEPVRPGSRDRRHRDGDDARWQDADARDTRRVLVSSRTGGSGRRSQDETDTSHYHDRGQDRPSREQASRGRERDYEYPDRRGTGLSEHPSSPRRAAARNGQPGSGRDYRDRPADGHRDQRGNGQPDYHSGPQRAYAGGDYPSGPLPVPDFAAGDFPSADYPSMDFGSGPLPAADYPSADYPSMDFGSGPLPAADHPSADYPSMDVPSGPLPAADYPSGEYPAAPAGTPRSSRSRSKSGPAKNGSGREQPESRRKPAKSQGPAKGRSRGKRDDDDWPSTEWDKLTDEQYWAELSSDKPLSTSGRATQAASHGTSRSANGGTQAASHLSAAPMPAAEPARELPSRKAPSPSREPATERLPVRARPQPPVPARAGNGSPATGRAEVTLPRPAEEPTLAVLSSLATSAPARPHGTLDEDPLTSPSFARPSLDSRSYHRPETPTSGSGAHLQPAASPASAGYGTPAYSTADYGPAGYGTDSYQPGSYQAGTDYPSLGYPDGDYGASVPADTYHQPRQAGPGYAYPAPQPPAAAPAASWHRPPDERAAVAGNPYGSHVEPAPASYQPSPAGHSNSHPSGGHAYPPGLASSHAGPGMSPAASHAADAGHYPMAGLYPQAGYPSDGGYGYEQHPSQAVYPVPQEAASYPPGYAGEYHPADPYDSNGYGYPAAQG